MFKKLVSNLPFNPAVLGQFVFYVKRLQHEETTRRFGLIVATVAFSVQIFGFIAPPESSLAADTNDIMYGGGTKQRMADTIRGGRDSNGRTDLQALYDYYGLDADMVANGSQTTISTVGSNNYYSIGRTRRSGSENIPVPIGNAQTSIYSRTLSGWARKSWDVVQVKNRHGQTMWVMNDCGNIVTNGHYTPPEAPKPTLNLVKQNSPQGSVKPGDTITYQLVYANTGGASPFTAIFDELPPHTSLASTSQPLWRKVNDTGRLKWVPDNSFAVLENTGSVVGVITVSVRVSDSAPHGANLCNQGYIGTASDSSGNFKYWGQRSVVCNTVVRSCPDGSVPSDSGKCPEKPAPDCACESVTITDGKDKHTKKITITARPVNGASVTGYHVDFGDGTSQEVKTSQTTTTLEKTYSKEPKTYKIKSVVRSSVGDKSSERCERSTDVTVEETPLPPVIQQSKKVSNLTQALADANGTTAQPGDTLEYTLTNTNISQQTGATNYALAPEDIADILEYADLLSDSIGDAQFDKTALRLSWPKQVHIDPGQTIVKQFRVKVKSPIPQTPAAASDPKSFDLIMFNSYGNGVTVRVPGSPGKTIEQTVAVLPKTGPGTGLIVSTLFFMLAAYLYGRGRVMRKEAELIRQEFSLGGF